MFCVTDGLVILVYKVWPASLIPKTTRGPKLIRYGRALVSTLLHAFVNDHNLLFPLHNLLYVPVQIANKMGH
jgi:hypothetical protein